MVYGLGEMQIDEQSDDGQYVETREDDEFVVKEGWWPIAYGFDQSTVTAQLGYELQEKLVLPFKLLWQCY